MWHVITVSRSADSRRSHGAHSRRSAQYCCTTQRTFRQAKACTGDVGIPDLFVLPDVALWRFEPPPPEGGRSSYIRDRLLGHGGRGVFARMWRRAMLLSDGQAEPDDVAAILSAVSEDAMVQVCERPGPFLFPELVRMFLDTWLDQSRVLPAKVLEDVTRDAAKQVAFLGGALSLAGMDSRP